MDTLSRGSCILQPSCQWPFGKPCLHKPRIHIKNNILWSLEHEMPTKVVIKYLIPIHMSLINGTSWRHSEISIIYLNYLLTSAFQCKLIDFWCITVHGRLWELVQGHELACNIYKKLQTTSMHCGQEDKKNPNKIIGLKFHMYENAECF